MSICADFSKKDWSDYARHYDSLCYLRPYTEMLSRVARMIQERPGPILDAACGTGNLEMVLSRLGNTSYVIGVDASEHMLARARNKVLQSTEYSFRHADLEKPLPFPNKCFRQVVSLNTLYAVKNPGDVLREFYRVLMPGGRIILVNPKHDYENGFILKAHCASQLPDVYWADAHASPEREEMLIRIALDDESVISSMLEIARINRNIAQNSKFHFLTKEQLTALVSSSGFCIDTIASIYANQDHFLTGTREDTPHDISLCGTERRVSETDALYSARSNTAG